MRKRRIGKVLITNQLIAEGDVDELARILKDLVVVRAEQMFSAESIEYIALSSKFEEIDSAEKIPEYRILIDSESKEVKYERVK